MLHLACTTRVVIKYEYKTGETFLLFGFNDCLILIDWFKKKKLNSDIIFEIPSSKDFFESNFTHNDNKKCYEISIYHIAFYKCWEIARQSFPIHF